jgi:two-component system chemotaxis response regulator CheY
MVEKDINILLVDDSEANRVLIKSMLDELGYKNIFQVIDGLDALNLIGSSFKEGKTFKLIIADWNMPRMTGLDLLVQLKSNADFASIPFLMMTSEEDIAFATLAISSGADQFIRKPVTLEILSEKLGQLMDFSSHSGSSGS